MDDNEITNLFYRARSELIASGGLLSEETAQAIMYSDPQEIAIRHVVLHASATAWLHETYSAMQVRIARMPADAPERTAFDTGIQMRVDTADKFASRPIKGQPYRRLSQTVNYSQYDKQPAEWLRRRLIPYFMERFGLPLTDRKLYQTIVNRTHGEFQSLAKSPECHITEFEDMDLERWLILYQCGDYDVYADTGRLNLKNPLKDDANTIYNEPERNLHLIERYPICSMIHRLNWPVTRLTIQTTINRINEMSAFEKSLKVTVRPATLDEL